MIIKNSHGMILMGFNITVSQYYHTIAHFYGICILYNTLGKAFHIFKENLRISHGFGVCM